MGCKYGRSSILKSEIEITLSRNSDFKEVLRNTKRTYDR